MSVRSETSHVPEKACKPTAAKRKRPAAANADTDTEPTPDRPKRHRIPSRAVREAASGGSSAPTTPPLPKRQRAAPCRNSPATPCDDLKALEELEVERQWGTFLLLHAAATIAHSDSKKS